MQEAVDIAETGSQTIQATDTEWNTGVQDSEFAIQVDRLSKIFRLYENPVDRLKESIHPRRKKYHTPFYALKDVSFSIRQGETVGIVGRNGSGKSTLLKIITGVLSPSGGNVQVNGKVSAILELGSGFNPELSGLENVFFSGMLMGYSHADMEQRLDAILSFADIGEFIHQPVKTYSSGMMVRLAFSVQTMVDAKILIVDEALAVGDEAFQRKCYARLERLCEHGTTLLYVSHHAASVVALCNHAILLHRGDLIVQGKPKFVVSRYQRIAHASGEQVDKLVRDIKAGKALESDREPGATAKADSTPAENAVVPKVLPQRQEETQSARFDPHMAPKSTVVYDSYGATIRNPRITTPDGRQVNVLVRGDTYQLRYEATFEDDAEDVFFAMLIKNNAGFPLGGSRSSSLRSKIRSIPKGTSYAVCFEFSCLLAPGFYFMNSGIQGSSSSTAGPFLHRILDIAMFRVQEEVDGSMTGIVDFRIEPSFTIETAE